MIYLIEKVWIDPMENHNFIGYGSIGYVETLEEAEKIVKEGKIFTQKDYWCYYRPTPEFKFTIINRYAKV